MEEQLKPPALPLKTAIIEEELKPSPKKDVL